MNYAFTPELPKALFHAAIDEYKDVFKQETTDDTSPAQWVKAMDQAIADMQRVDSDTSLQSEHPSPLAKDQITKIGDYAISILDMCLTHIDSSREEPSRDFTRLSIPITVWVARHGGRINSIDMVVNSVAGFANEIQDTAQLSELCTIIGEIIAASADSISQDLDQTNPMRPWRVINMNYGIIATRSHDTALMKQAYDILIKNLPQDARQFFKEGMQQMKAIGYPDEVRAVIEQYDREWGSGSTLH